MAGSTCGILHLILSHPLYAPMNAKDVMTWLWLMFWIPSVTISKIVIGYSTIDLKGPIRYVTLRACECFTIFFAWGFPNKKIGTFRRRLQVGICFCASMPEENTVKVLDFQAYGKYNYATHCGLIVSLLGTYTQWLRIFVVVKSIENLSGTRASIH